PGTTGGCNGAPAPRSHVAPRPASARLAADRAGCPPRRCPPGACRTRRSARGSGPESVVGAWASTSGVYPMNQHANETGRHRALLRAVPRGAVPPTSAQKVGQLIQADIDSITPDDLAHYPLGSVLNGGNSSPHGDKLAPPGEWLALADRFYDRIGEITALEVRVTGLDWAFSPSAAVARDAPWGRTYESRRTPSLVRRCVEALVAAGRGRRRRPSVVSPPRWRPPPPRQGRRS